MALGYGRTGTNNFATANFIVDGNGLQTGATHTTIQGAIDDATGGETILIRPGTYTENITLKSNICLKAFSSQDAASGTVIVQGKITPGTTEFCYISGLWLANSTDFVFEDTGTTTGAITFDNCRFVGDGLNNLLVNSNANRSLVIHFSEISNPSGSKVLNQTAGSTVFRYCVFSTGSSTISTISGGTFGFSFCSGAFPFQTTGSASFVINNSTVSSANQLLIDHQATTQGIMQICSLRTNGTAVAINVGAGASIVSTGLDINTANATPITGTGTFNYDSVGWIQNAPNAIAPSSSFGSKRIRILELDTALDEVYGGTGQTTFSTGDILYASGSNTLAKLAAGTNGDVLTLASGVPSWAASGGGGAWELISTATASSSATISFTDLTSSYFMYMVVIDQMIPATDAIVFRMRTSTNNGSSYDSGASDYAWSLLGNNGVTGSYSSDDQSDSELQLTDSITVGSGAEEGLRGLLYLINPSAANYTHVNSYLSFVSSGGNIATAYVAGARKSSADVDAIQFSCSSGNIASGTFKLYGLAAS